MKKRNSNIQQDFFDTDTIGLNSWASGIQDEISDHLALMFMSLLESLPTISGNTKEYPSCQE